MPRLNYWNSSHADLVWQECGLVWTLDGFSSKLTDQHLTNPVFKDVAWLFFRPWIYPSFSRGLKKTCLPAGSLFRSTDRRSSHHHYCNYSHLCISKHMHHCLRVTCFLSVMQILFQLMPVHTALQWKPQNQRLTVTQDAGIYTNR